VEIERRPDVDENQRAEYEQIVTGARSHGPNGRILFSVSTDSLDEGRGDLFVALGLAKYLSRLGWGVGVWPMSRWGTDIDDDVDVVISMLESFVPGLMPDRTARIAWVRNWTDAWAELPFLAQFDGVWASSSAAADKLAPLYGRTVPVVPIAADDELFAAGDDEVDMTVSTTVNSWGTPRQIDSVLGELARHVDVSLFGTRSHEQTVPHAAHAGAVSYFSLPDAYRRSLIVIDDLIEQARVYGNQNSRLFESISAGALPITNVREGLDELGLGAVPSYGTAGELIELVQGFSADRAGCRELLEGLQSVVAARHTFQTRATEAEPLIRQAIETAAARAPRPELFRTVAEQSARLIFTSTISDHRQAELEREQAVTESLREELEEAALSLEGLRSELAVCMEELMAFRERRLTRAESLLRNSVSSAARAPRRAAATLRHWTR
jgi:hypothetical protein